MSEPIIEIEDIWFSYGAEPVLEGVSLEVIRGDILGLIGPNGSGKTTLLKLILGLLSPQRGTIRLFGQELGRFREWARLGYVRQRGWDFERNFPASVEEIVRLGRVPRLRWGAWRRIDTEAVERALHAVHIEGLRHRPISELSGGQQQRVFLARVLAQEPEILVLDEPTAAVDPKVEAEFYKLLRKLNREQGLTILLVSHDLEAIVTQVTKIACLNRKLLFCGTPQECLASDLLERVYVGKRLMHHQHPWG
ncbi:MAG: metal ABC transporter ATP-binding protein [Candidatus Bipolaricaulota bacterium]|nr:metal ABC transporter ATP-binding protein [Candidatus Bipolaricaulota bacterium]MDW8030506.1 metal ABC transporter ATP-binding protein [Candidatus Bipolaricaulota bacterium]